MHAGVRIGEGNIGAIADSASAEMVFPSDPLTNINNNSTQQPLGPGVGLGLSFSDLLDGSLGRADETPGHSGSASRSAYSASSRDQRAGEVNIGDHTAGGGMRMPLSRLSDANGSPGGVRMVEGKARRPVSVEVTNKVGRGKRTLGSLRAVMRGSEGSEAFL